MFDKDTVDYYDSHYDIVYHNYEKAVLSELHDYLLKVFPEKKSAILDIGAGTGRDMRFLLKKGYDVYGIDGSRRLVEKAVSSWPELAERLVHSYIPEKSQDHPILQRRYDGILLSAVLMHIPRAYLFDAVYFIRNRMQDESRLVVSLPLNRKDVRGERDSQGRLFSDYKPEYIKTFFARAGFRFIEETEASDGLGRGFLWTVMLFELEREYGKKPLDKIESILNRDRKTTTYKYALFRAFSDLSRDSFHSAVWISNEKVGVPVEKVAEKWINYFWPIFNEEIIHNGRFIPQANGETRTSQKAGIKFRAEFRELISQCRKSGGFSDYREVYLSPDRETLEKGRLIISLHRKISNAVIRGPVHFSGGSLSDEEGKIFEYDRKTQCIVMDALLWKEFSLMNHWIEPAVILRWAELTKKIADRTGADVSTGDILDLLLWKDSERDTSIARAVYDRWEDRRCVWTGKKLQGSQYDVDHLIPFSLWHNNSLWNLLPSDRTINIKKSDKLPDADFLYTKKGLITESWGRLQDAHKYIFHNDYINISGDVSSSSADFDRLFSSVLESVEVTAAQRNIPRWPPNSKESTKGQQSGFLSL